MTRTLSSGTPKALATHCAITASGPRPCSVAPPRPRGARPADAVEGGGRMGDLDEAREAEPAKNAAPAQLRLLGAQPFVAHHRHDLVERGVVRELLELYPGGRRARIAVVGNEVAA